MRSLSALAPSRRRSFSRSRGVALLGLLAWLAPATDAHADEPPAPDPLVGTWTVDVASTAKGISEATAHDLDALPAAERAEELLRRETFLKALRFAAAADGTFRLGIPDEAPRSTRGTWAAKGPGAYRFTFLARFGVPCAGADAGPIEARIDGGALSFRDRDGTRLLLLRPGAPVVSQTPAPPATPVAAVPGAHPAAYVATWELDRDRMLDVALELARKQLESLDPEQRKRAEAVLLRDQARDVMRLQLEAMEIRVELRGDGTLRASLGMPKREMEEAAGTWEEVDGKVILTLTTTNARPASGEDRKPVQGRLDGGILWIEMRPDAAAIPLRKTDR